MNVGYRQQWNESGSSNRRDKNPATAAGIVPPLWRDNEDNFSSLNAPKMQCFMISSRGWLIKGYQPQWGNNWTPIWRRFPKYKRIMPRFVWLEWKLLEPMSRLPRLPLFPRLPNLSDWNKSSRNDASYQMQRQTYLDIGVNSYFKRYPTAAGYQCHCHAE